MEESTHSESEKVLEANGFDASTRKVQNLEKSDINDGTHLKNTSVANNIANDSHSNIPILKKSSGLNHRRSSIDGKKDSLDAAALRHMKVAEAAVTGWEKATAESMALKVQLEQVMQQKEVAEKKVGRLDGALKECMRELRRVREEHSRRVQETVSEKAREWQQQRTQLEARALETQQHLQEQLAESTAELDAMSALLEERNSVLQESESETRHLSLLLKQAEKQNAQAEESVSQIKALITHFHSFSETELPKKNGLSDDAELKTTVIGEVSTVKEIQIECDRLYSILASNSSAFSSLSTDKEKDKTLNSPENVTAVEDSSSAIEDSIQNLTVDGVESPSKEDTMSSALERQISESSSMALSETGSDNTFTQNDIDTKIDLKEELSRMKKQREKLLTHRKSGSFDADDLTVSVPFISDGIELVEAEKRASQAYADAVVTMQRCEKLESELAATREKNRRLEKELKSLTIHKPSSSNVSSPSMADGDDELASLSEWVTLSSQVERAVAKTEKDFSNESEDSSDTLEKKDVHTVVTENVVNKKDIVNSTRISSLKISSLTEDDSSPSIEDALKMLNAKKKESTFLRTKLAEMSVQLAEARAQLSQSHEEEVEEEEESGGRKSREKELTESLEEAKSKIESLKEELAKSKQETADVDEELATVEDMVAQLSEGLAEKEGIRAELAAAHAKIAQLSDELTRWREETADLRAELASAHGAVAELSMGLGSGGEGGNSSKEMNAAKERIADLSAELEEWRHETATLRSELAWAKTRVGELVRAENEAVSLRAKLSRAHARIAELEKSSSSEAIGSSLKNTNHQISPDSKHDMNSNQSDAAKSASHQTSDSTSANSSAIVVVDKTNSVDKEAFDSSIPAIRPHAVRRDAPEADVDSLIATLEKERDEAYREIREMRETEEELKDALDRAERWSAELESRLADEIRAKEHLHSEAQRLRAENASLSVRLVTATERASLLEASLLETEAKVADVRRSLVGMHREKISADMDLAAANAARVHLGDKLDRVADVNARMVSMVGENRYDHDTYEKVIRMQQDIQERFSSDDSSGRGNSLSSKSRFRSSNAIHSRTNSRKTVFDEIESEMMLGKQRNGMGNVSSLDNLLLLSSSSSHHPNPSSSLNRRRLPSSPIHEKAGHQSAASTDDSSDEFHIASRSNLKPSWDLDTKIASSISSSGRRSSSTAVSPSRGKKSPSRISENRHISPSDPRSLSERSFETADKVASSSLSQWLVMDSNGGKSMSARHFDSVKEKPSKSRDAMSIGSLSPTRASAKSASILPIVHRSSLVSAKGLYAPSDASSATENVSDWKSSVSGTQNSSGLSALRSRSRGSGISLSGFLSHSKRSNGGERGGDRERGDAAPS